MRTVHIVSYTVPPSRQRFYVRDESNPNRRSWATRFESVGDAENAADEIRENCIGITGRTPRFRFESFLE